MLLQIVVCCVQFVRYGESRAGMERVFEPVALCTFATASSDSPAARQIKKPPLLRWLYVFLKMAVINYSSF